MKDREPKRNRGTKLYKLRRRSASVENDVADHADNTSQWLPVLTIVAVGSLLTMSPSDLCEPALPSIMKSAPKWFDMVDLEWLFTDMSFTNSNNTPQDPYGTRKLLGFRNAFDPAILSNSKPAMLYPLLTENLPNVLNRTPGGEMFPSTSRSNDPSLLDIEAIDVFWRRDIDIEKGAPWLEQSHSYDQSERDIQVLSEKMFRPTISREYQYPLSHGSSSPFSDFENTNSWTSSPGHKLSPPWSQYDSGNTPSSSTSGDSGCPLSEECEFDTSSYYSFLKSVQLQQEEREPLQLEQEKIKLSHEELARSPSSQIPFRNASYLPLESPIVQNVSLFSANNHPKNESDSYTAITSNPDFDNSFYDELEMDPNLVPFDPNLEGEAYNLLYGESEQLQPVPEETLSELQSTEQYNEDSQTETEHATSLLDIMMHPERETPSPDNENSENIYWNADAPSSSSSSSPSSSGDYSSRLYDKLVPMLDSSDYNTDRKSLTRGRQSVDEQLARMHNLPFTPHEITNWTFQELQRNVRGVELTEVQKELIRKIRRRGKNKVAARACRKRKESLFRYASESENYCDAMEESELREEALERQRELLEQLTLHWEDQRRTA